MVVSSHQASGSPQEGHLPDPDLCMSFLSLHVLWVDVCIGLKQASSSGSRNYLLLYRSKGWLSVVPGEWMGFGTRVKSPKCPRGMELGLVDLVGQCKE